MKRRSLIIGLAALIVILASGVRIRTQTGWKTPVTYASRTSTKNSGDAHLHLTLVDTRNGAERTYNWWLETLPEAGQLSRVEVDCGEFKAVTIWRLDTGIRYYGERFKKLIDFAKDSSGTEGIYDYKIAWSKKEPSPPREQVSSLNKIYAPIHIRDASAWRRLEP